MKNILFSMVVAACVYITISLLKQIFLPVKTVVNTANTMQQKIPVAANKKSSYKAEVNIDISNCQYIYAAGMPVVWNYY